MSVGEKHARDIINQNLLNWIVFAMEWVTGHLKQGLHQDLVREYMLSYKHLLVIILTIINSKYIDANDVKRVYDILCRSGVIDVVFALQGVDDEVLSHLAYMLASTGHNPTAVYSLGFDYDYAKQGFDEPEQLN